MDSKTSRVQCFEHDAWMTRGDHEKGLGRALGFAAFLFPVLHGARADADHQGELLLARSQTTPDALDIGCSYGCPASGALRAAADLSCLFDALDQLGKQFVIHSGGLCVPCHVRQGRHVRKPRLSTFAARLVPSSPPRPWRTLRALILPVQRPLVPRRPARPGLSLRCLRWLLLKPGRRRSPAWGDFSGVGRTRGGRRRIL